MTRMFLALGLALSMMTAGAVAQERLSPDPAIQSTIQSQIDAFLDNDLEGAWRHASPTIQGYFQTPENFGRMVEQGYPMVWRPSDVDFLDLQSLGGIIVQRVQVIDQQGRPHMLAYQMIETESGWQINGVQILPAPQVGA